MDVKIDKDIQQKIPSQGPLLIVANRPAGIDGENYLYELLKGVREDFKILINSKLSIADKDPRFICSQPEAIMESPLKKCQIWLEDGHALVFFPAKKIPGRKLLPVTYTRQEKNWSRMLSILARQTKSAVLPVHFKSVERSRLVPGRIKKQSDAITATKPLPSEYSIQVFIGKPIEFHQYNSVKDDSVLAEYFRFRTHLLGHLAGPKLSSVMKKTARLKNSLTRIKNTVAEKIIDPIPVDKLLAELNALSEEEFLVQADEFKVYLVKMDQTPSLLQEIGRLREITFRDVGEGTGKKIDLDKFDRYYHHLVVWNQDKQEIVGAYRVGLANEILHNYGKKFLYTSTLFKYPSRFIREMGPALEMGRSFIRKEYQENFGAFRSLWKGIGAFIVRHPQYKMMFGPVSISSDYKEISREILVKFLEYNHAYQEGNYRIRPRVPLKTNIHKSLNRRMEMDIFKSIEEVSDILVDIETKEQDMPPLLKQYLTLGGRIESFNVDPKFNNALDGLIVVDVTRANRRLLQFYLGKEGSEKFLSYHEAKELFNLEN